MERSVLINDCLKLRGDQIWFNIIVYYINDVSLKCSKCIYLKYRDERRDVIAVLRYQYFLMLKHIVLVYKVDYKASVML